MADEEYLRVKDAAQHLGVSRAKIWRLLKDGRLKAFKDPRDERVTLVRKEDLEPFKQIRPA